MAEGRSEHGAGFCWLVFEPATLGQGAAWRLEDGQEKRGCWWAWSKGAGGGKQGWAAPRTGPGKNPKHQLWLCSCSKIAAKCFEVQIKVFHQVGS